MSDPNIIQQAHDIGTLEGQVAAIFENTKLIPELVKKVERHDVQLSLIQRVGGTALFVFISSMLAWVKSHFFSAR